LWQTCSDKDFFIFGQLSGQVERIPAFAAFAPANYECDLIHYLHDSHQFSCKIQVINFYTPKSHSGQPLLKIRLTHQKMGAI
jgi:hypothetical protein